MTDSARPVVIAIGAIAPYTDLLYDRLASEIDRPLHVLACCQRERDRYWEITPRPSYDFEVLPGFSFYRNSLSTIYVNPKLPLRMRALQPAVLILNDFSPSMMMTAWAARVSGVPYGVRTDGRSDLDPGQSSTAHRFLRRQVVAGASFGLGPCQRSLDLLTSYGLDGDRARLSPLFPAWHAEPDALSKQDRPFDVLFCGTLNEEVKGALFFADVVLRCAALGRKLKVRVVGDGPLRQTLEAKFAEAGVDAHFDGFLPQQRLGEAYASAKLFLFPSRCDVWGVVVQEALQSGACVIASPHAGASVDLVEAYGCGVMLPLQNELWVDSVLDLLEDAPARAAFRVRAAPALADHSIDRAVTAYKDALQPYLA